MAARLTFCRINKFVLNDAGKSNATIYRFSIRSECVIFWGKAETKMCGGIFMETQGFPG
jgi:hypothetical protein